MIERNQAIERINIEDEMQRAYIDYSMSVIVGRALPDARDGMKPGNRRILFAMRERGWTHGKAYVKCAKVVGEVIGNYHPHGDMAVYDTLVRMAQDFSMRVPMIDGQGNFGSIDGDRPAAYRYTECRLMREAEVMLEDIDKDTVNMRPNFDETLMEPAVLPARLPNLLVNGSTGIAVGMATNIPPHNLGEIIDGIVYLIDHPDCTIDALCGRVKGPDFPTGGIICGLAPIREMYEKGRGRIKVRGRAAIETTRSGKEAILITEIPYAVNKTNLITKIADLVRNKKLEGIADLRDESGKEGIRIVIELKKSAVPKVLLNNLFKHTQLETTFGAIMLAIDHGKPREMNLKDLMQCYIDHRFEVITRRSQFELEKAEARAHVLEGLKIALDHLDAVVKTIRDSGSRGEADARLRERFGLTEIQTKAILEMRLYQLTGLERDKVEEEYLEVIKRINELRDLLASRSKLLGVVKEDLQEMRQSFDTPRKTDIVADEGEINIEDLIADERCVITMTHSGYIKRVPTTAYRKQRRGGKGVIGMSMKESDFVENVFLATTHDYLLCLTDTGMLHWQKVYDVPEGSRTSKGKAIVNLLQMESGQKLASLIRVREFRDDQFLIMATRRGIVKKTALSAYANVRAKGIIAINIDEGDELIGVIRTDGEQDVMLTSRNGLSIRFAEDELRTMGRATRGVKGMTLSRDDEIVGIECVDPAATMMVVTENGYGKRTSFDDYRRQGRGGKGIITIRTSERNGKVVGAHNVTDTDALMLISSQGQMIQIDLSDIRVIGRNTQGVRVINLAQNDRLIAAAPVEPDPRKEEGDEGLPGGNEEDEGEAETVE
jgi:DNA gyrase subunit A